MDNREIEVKILNVDIKKMVAKLESLGAKRVGEYNYARIIYDYPDNSLDKDNAWIRLRTDGKKTTLTYKQKLNKNIDGMREEEMFVDDFENTRNILKNIGFEEKRFQENRRVKFELNNSEVTIELWPKLEPHLEVESKTKNELIKTLTILGIKLNETTTKTPKEVYQDNGIDLHDNKYKDLKLEEEKKLMKI